MSRGDGSQRRDTPVSNLFLSAQHLSHHGNTSYRDSEIPSYRIHVTTVKNTNVGGHVGKEGRSASARRSTDEYSHVEICMEASPTTNDKPVQPSQPLPACAKELYLHTVTHTGPYSLLLYRNRGGISPGSQLMVVSTWDNVQQNLIHP